MTRPPELPMRQFDRSLPMALLRAREAVMKKFSPALREHGLSPQQWRVIRVLVEEEALDATEIAERCALLMPSLSRILQNLHGRGLVDRKTASDDQRRSMVSITSLGRQLFEALSPINEARYAYITEKFGYGKLELLYELLDELVEKIDQDEGDKP
ncbi:MAG: homoprotocatechuate degradation operon regulator HpaR [Halieaceae bacterium]|nr:homoprotocatechuate degradation operon regulator HpaR [Halieaceae bacterium]